MGDGALSSSLLERREEEMTSSGDRVGIDADERRGDRR